MRSSSRAKLLLHILLVPLFLTGNLALVVGIIRLDWLEPRSVPVA